MSPWVATTRLSLVATMTLQPVPQNRHGALSHFNSLALRSVTRLAAPAATGMPPASAAIAAASSLRTCRRSSLGAVMGSGSGVEGVEDERGGIDVGQQRQRVERGAERAGIRRIDHDDELALGIAAVDFASLQRDDGGFHVGQPLRARLHQNTGDFAARWRDHA